MNIFIILSVIFAVIILNFGIIAYLFSVMKKRLDTVVREDLSRETILMKSYYANFFGQESRGFSQIRGNGILVLTENFLYFQMLVPRKKLIIPVSSMTGTQIVRTFLAKTKFRPLLKVSFHTDEGNDSAAWLLKDPHSWKERLDEMIQYCK